MLTLLNIPYEAAQPVFGQFFDFLDTIPGAATAFAQLISSPGVSDVWQWIIQ